MGRDLKKTFRRRRYKMAGRRKKMLPTTVTRVRIKTSEKSSAAEGSERLELYTSLGGCDMLPFEKSLWFLIQLHLPLTYHPAVLVLDIYPKDKYSRKPVCEYLKRPFSSSPKSGSNPNVLPPGVLHPFNGVSCGVKKEQTADPAENSKCTC